MKVPKTITGIGVILLGAIINLIPAVGQVASPYIMGAGAAMIGVGGIDKVIKKRNGVDIWEGEKKIIKSLKKRGGK
jgi:hypothetical protein